MSKVYEMVQERILNQIEEAIENGGTAPWRKPWVGGIPKNYLTRKPYRGINLMLLDGGEYLTFNQIKQLQKKNREIKLKKGSKSHIIVFWTFYEKENDEGEEETIPVLKYYRVFHVSDVEGIKAESLKEFETNPIEDAEQIVSAYGEEVKIEIVKGSGRAYYSPGLDQITMPHIKQFKEAEEYYSTMFHEMAHSTGHITRLKRFDDNDQTKFGSKSYSKEELVAEITSNMMLSMIGIETPRQQENSVSYLYSWMKVIKKDPKLIVSAAQQAQKAADFIFEKVGDERWITNQPNSVISA